MKQESQLEDLLTIDSMLDSLKAICSKLLEKEREYNIPLSAKKLDEQKTKTKNITRLRKNINSKLSHRTAA